MELFGYSQCAYGVIPNLICMLILSKEVAQDIKAFQPEIDNRHTEKRSSSDACLQDTK